MKSNILRNFMEIKEMKEKWGTEAKAASKHLNKWEFFKINQGLDQEESRSFVQVSHMSNMGPNTQSFSIAFPRALIGHWVRSGPEKASLHTRSARVTGENLPTTSQQPLNKSLWKNYCPWTDLKYLEEIYFWNNNIFPVTLS